MSDPSERPETPASEAPPNEPVDAANSTPASTPPQNQSVEPSTDGNSATEGTSPLRPTRSSWFWLLAGLLAAILVPIGVQSVLGNAVEMTDEQRKLNDQAALNDEDTQRLEEIVAEATEARL